MHRFHGSCHCGNIAVAFATAVEPEKAAIRACECSFCRKHGARAVSDPRGRMEFMVKEPDLLERYRFGLRQTDFLVCRRCGVYVGAYMEDGEAGLANVMVNVLDDRVRFAGQPVPTVYDGENAAGKRERRRRNWTPASLQIGGG